MAYPYAAPAADKADGSSTPTDHPAHHNTLANALVDLLAELGTNPSGVAADLTVRLASLDTTVAAETTARTGADTAESAARTAADALAIPLSQKAAPNGVATLGADSKLPAAQIPALALVDTFVVGSQAAMLALAAGQGDVAIRNDIAQTFILQGADPTILSNWVAMPVPAAPVTSVNSATGAVVLSAADVGAVPAATYDANTILKADTDNTPVALAMGASTILARLAAGGIVAATPSQLKALLAVVAADVSDFDAQVNTHHVNDLTVPSAATAWNNKRLTGLGDATAAADALNRQSGDARYQLVDAELSALAGLVSAADKLPYFTGAGSAALAPTTQAGRDLLTRAVNAQTGTTYTLVAADVGQIVTMSNASAQTLTVPPNSSVAFPIGTRVEVYQLGAAATTIAAGAGVTINAPFGSLVLPRQFAKCELVKVATDTWMAIMVSQQGVELGYAEITSNPPTTTAIGQTNAVDVTGLTVTVTVGNRPVTVHAFCPQVFNATASSGVGIKIMEGAAFVGAAVAGSAGANGNNHLNAWARISPSAGSHTYKVMWHCLVGGTANMSVNAPGSYPGPAFIRVIEG